MKSGTNGPLCKTLAEYCAKERISFHMPGHKMGRGFPDVFKNNLASFDLTEIHGLDNLHFPEGVIGEAQVLAARAFGAEATFFLVNGSTVGIHAAVMSVCSPGDRLIVQRDCHRSVAGALMIAGAEPVFLNSGYDKSTGISLPPSPVELEQVLYKNKNAAGILLTRPGYYGQCSDIRRLVDVAHKWNKPVIVDEAHGAHFAFSKSLPESAAEAGADITIQSAHKTLPALTQGAFLHLGERRLVSSDRLTANLRVLQTTSPSYIIMASLEFAAVLMAEKGEDMLNSLLGDIAHLKANIEGSGINAIDGANLPVHSFDDTRLVFCLRDVGISGFEADRMLREDHNIQVEMSDPVNIVCIATTADGENELGTLQKALVSISTGRVKKHCLPIFLHKEELPEKAALLTEAMRLKKVRVPVEKSAGRICAGIITPYPPGIPVLWPGELINTDMPDRIKMFRELGGTINGIYHDGTLDCLS